MFNQHYQSVFNIYILRREKIRLFLKFIIVLVFKNTSKIIFYLCEIETDYYRINGNLH